MIHDTRTLQRYRWTISARGLALLSATTFALILPNAQAALGGNAASVTADRTALAPAGSTATATTSATTGTSAYTVQTLVDTGGTTIHEYLDSTGTVFAIAWVGPFMPNLSQLLGTYFASYTSTVAANQASQTSQTVRSPAAVDTGEVVVKSGGHMQAFRGKAYLKNRLPGGFTVDQIR